MNGRDVTARFSDRVADYVKYRPGYPRALRDALEHEVGIGPDSVVADVGAGTGISTDLLRQIGCMVYAIEPNAEMRQAAEQRFAGDARVHSISGRAEATGLADASVDAIVAGQAFHWFDRAKTRREFARILRSGGTIAIFWNVRQTDGTPFLRAYEQLLRDYGTDYAEVHHVMNDDDLRLFFGDAWQTRTFSYEQVFDFDGIRGRLLSSSYVPKVGHANYEPMLAALRRIFDAHADGGHVRVLYDTDLYFGRLASMTSTA
jgi:ubiquinone/menaquinone biosynthesis C-methylase UbiE